MYRVMIIDDERAIRSMLRLSIDWKNFNMEVAGEAASGIEAINTIDDISPQVVFVDIKMPFMDGIEFSSLAKERYPQLKIVVLTAFDEFEYARECIGVGVMSYLLKPINRHEINDVLIKLKEHLDEENPIDETKISAISPGKDKIKRYIEKHYKEEDLNLTKMAIDLNYNSSYLSRRIRQDTGKTFTVLLMEERMNYAVQLAAVGTPMYIAAKESGIPDPNYFGKCFKKITGINYSEYMERRNNDG